MTDKPDEVAELVEVTHADIDALHAAYTEQWGKPAFAVYNADHWLAKAFARHRIATLTSLSRRVEELEAFVGQIAERDDSLGDDARAILPIITAGEAAARAELEHGKDELRRLMQVIWRQEYRNEAPDWQPLPDLVGMITQIDNMYAGVRQQRDEALHRITSARAEGRRAGIEEAAKVCLEHDWGGKAYDAIRALTEKQS